MRKLMAFAISFFFLMNAAVASAVAAQACCDQPCKAAMACVATSCAGCTAAAVLPATPDASASVGTEPHAAAGDEVLALGPVEAVWGPPD
jgi:hypothetical protein